MLFLVLTMFTITASWHITEQHTSYNDWDELEPVPFGQGLTTMLDMFQHPHNHECGWEGQDPESEDFYVTSLNLGRGLYLVQEGHKSFSGSDTRETLPLLAP